MKDKMTYKEFRLSRTPSNFEASILIALFISFLPAMAVTIWHYGYHKSVNGTIVQSTPAAGELLATVIASLILVVSVSVIILAIVVKVTTVLGYLRHRCRARKFGK